MEQRPTNEQRYVLKFGSPKDNKGNSNLLDSYELQAITKQLNRAIRASSGLPTSPFYAHRLEKIHRKNAKTSKKITFLKQSGEENWTSSDGSRGRGVLCLWKKVKQAFMKWDKSR